MHVEIILLHKYWNTTVHSHVYYFVLDYVISIDINIPLCWSAVYDWCVKELRRSCNDLRNSSYIEKTMDVLNNEIFNFYQDAMKLWITMHFLSLDKYKIIFSSRW